MTFEEFFNCLEIMNEAMKEEFQEKMILESFGAWQVVEVIKGIAGSKAKSLSFKDYIERLGIIEKKEKSQAVSNVEKIETKIIKAKALKTAEEILQMDRRAKND